jgi:hypothetical protein
MAVHASRTMSEAVNDLQERRFTANFDLTEGIFHDVNSGRTFRAEELPPRSRQQARQDCTWLAPSPREEASASPPHR